MYVLPQNKHDKNKQREREKKKGKKREKNTQRQNISIISPCFYLFPSKFCSCRHAPFIMQNQNLQSTKWDFLSWRSQNGKKIDEQ